MPINETAYDRTSPFRSRWLRILGGLAILVGLYGASRYNYLLFHSLVEIFSIVVAFSLFTIIWNSRRMVENNYLVFVGIAYLFIGFLDLLHTLSYKGMSIFPDYDYYANQLWIAARGMESLSLLAGFFFFKKRREVHSEFVLVGFGLLTSLLVASIFYWKIFPVCFVEGVGLTPFKKISEYIICGILAASLVLLRIERDRFEKPVHRLLFWALVWTMGSELAFTFYISNYGFSNLVGHYLKLLSFICIYKAIVETAIRSPYSLIFRNLKEKERELEKQATIDPATGVYNRRIIFALLQQDLQQARRDRRPLSLAFLDLDRLKEINDVYGHHEGDTYIRQAVDCLNASIREADYIARMGGDEFLVVLPNCPHQKAVQVIERARGRLTAAYESSPKLYLPDFSCGFAEYRSEDSIDIERLIETADNEMYKEKGRKRGEASPRLGEGKTTGDEKNDPAA